MKKILSIFISAIIILSFSSCHGTLVPKETTTSGGIITTTDDTKKVIYPSEFDNTKEYNIVFWAKNDSRNDQLEVYQNAIKSFETYYPNIHIEIKNYTDYKLIYNDVIINIPTNTTPNVCIAYPDHVATYLEGENVVADLDQLMDNQSYGLGGKDVKFDSIKKEEVVSKFLEEGYFNGRHSVLPFVRSSEALYINKQYVERLGFEIPDIPTWDWLWALCQKALESEKYGENGVLYPFIYKSSDNLFITDRKQKGQDFTVNGKVKFLDETTKTYLLDLNSKASNGLFSTFTQIGYPANFLNKWQAVCAVDSTAGATWMGYGASTHDAGSGAQGDYFDTVVRPIPQYDVANPKMISQGPSICVFGKSDANEVIASWLFAQFLITNEVQIGYAKTEGYVPVTTKAINSNEYQAYLNNPNEYGVKLAASKLVIDNINNTFITEVYTGSSYARDAASYLVECVVQVKSRFNTYEKMDDLFTRTINQKKLAPYIEDEGE